MISSRLAKLIRGNESAWGAGLAVVVVGTAFKVGYWNFSRGVMVDTMEERHLKAMEHLKGARAFGSRAAKEREEKAPPLTAEQKEQLREYLELMKESRPDVYPQRKRRQLGG